MIGYYGVTVTNAFISIIVAVVAVAGSTSFIKDWSPLFIPVLVIGLMTAPFTG